MIARISAVGTRYPAEPPPSIPGPGVADGDASASDPGSVTIALANLGAPDPHVRNDAAQRLWDRFAPRLCALVRSRLNARIRAREDENDIVQNLFLGFFASQQRERYSLKDREEFWRLMVRMTLCKVANAVHHHQRARRDVRREQAAAHPSGTPEDGIGPSAAMLPSRGLSAEAEVISRLELERILNRLDEGQRRILAWKLEGFTNAQIGRKIQRTERTVELKLGLIRRNLAAIPGWRPRCRGRPMTGDHDGGSMMTEIAAETLDQIVEIADRFESEWRRGGRPRLEEFLDRAPPAHRAETLHSLLRIELDARRELGESPRADEYAGRFPPDRDLIDAVFSDRPDAPASSPAGRGPDADATMPSVPGYRLIQHAGTGTSGEVWLAEDENLFNRPVALKMIRGRIPAETRPSVLESLASEVERLVGVRHPNLVQVFGRLESQDEPGLVLQSVPGGSLADRLARDGPMDWRTAARYVADVAEGLIAVHGRGVIHRDVRPANILQDPENGEAVLTAFGVGVRLAGSSPAGESIAYMAPEAFDGRIEPAVDVYGLAATLFTLITGQQPFPASSVADLRDRVSRGLPDPDPRCTGMPVPLERIIRDGLVADPECRPGLEEFRSTLRGSLNRLLADSLAMDSPAAGPGPAAAVAAPTKLRLLVSRQVGPNKFVPIAVTHDWVKPAATRDPAKVPPEPDQVLLRTGDRVRIEAVSDRLGFLTVFNIGPVGELSVLYPDELQQAGTFAAPMVRANQTVQILDVAVTLFAGRERLFAVWSREPLALSLDRLQSLVDPKGKKMPASRPYLATRDIQRVHQAMARLPRDDWRAVSIELDHEPQEPEPEPADESSE